MRGKKNIGIFLLKKKKKLLIWTSGILVQEKKLKRDFSIFSSGGHLVHWSGIVLSALIESRLSNIPAKFD